LERYSEQTKLAAIDVYLSGQRGLVATAEQMGVGVSSLRKWIATYEANGVAGIRVKRSGQWYDLEFKLEVLKRARDDGLSNRQAAALFNIRNFNIIATWERAYEAYGMAGLDSRRTGCRARSFGEGVPEPRGDDDICSRQELLKELSSFGAENAYLKKVEALVRSQKTSAPSKGRRS
jgi:transposase